MNTVGIIANPASGRDIRRLVAYGTVFDNQEKVNIVRRILLGLVAAQTRQVFFMPDYFGIVRQALEGLSRTQPLPLEIVHLRWQELKGRISGLLRSMTVSLSPKSVLLKTLDSVRKARPEN